MKSRQKTKSPSNFRAAIFGGVITFGARCYFLLSPCLIIGFRYFLSSLNEGPNEGQFNDGIGNVRRYSPCRFLPLECPVG